MKKTNTKSPLVPLIKGESYEVAGGFGALAFTLVELIVVITILAILGIIAFLSLNAYAGDARNTKKISDLSQLNKVVPMSIVKGRNILSLVVGSGSTIISSTNIKIGGFSGYNALSGSYVAGNINYDVIGEKEMNSKNDVINFQQYKIGATSFYNQYEISATIEKFSGENDTLVVGNWNPRNMSDTEIPIKTISGNFVHLEGETTINGKIRVGDLVSISGSNYIVRQVKNLDELYLDSVVSTVGTTISLAQDESTHIIKNRSSDSQIAIGKGNDFTPYKLN